MAGRGYAAGDAACRALEPLPMTALAGRDVRGSAGLWSGHV